MKLNPIHKQLRLSCGILALLVSAVCACAQSNSTPDPSSFSQFIADRNIFDPNRVSHEYNPRRSYRPSRSVPRGTPGIQFVGTMSYEKGIFAFFSGNNSDLSKVLQSGQQIAGYKITAITANSVALESADKKEPVELKIGDGFRQENNKWVLSKAGEMPIESSAPVSVSSSSAESSSTDNASSTPAAPPPSATEQNDVLKRLMEQREKENQ